MVWEYLTAVRDSRTKEREKLVKLQKMWALRKPVLDAHILSLQKRIQQLEEKIDDIVLSCITQDSGLCSVRLEASTVGPVDTSIS